MQRASTRARPVRSSVRRDAQAMEVVQPRQRKRASVMRPCSTRTESSRTSPQTGFETLTTAEAPAREPALRGFLKWSRTASENMAKSMAMVTDRRKAGGAERRSRLKQANSIVNRFDAVAFWQRDKVSFIDKLPQSYKIESVAGDGPSETGRTRHNGESENGSWQARKFSSSKTTIHN